MKIFSSHLSKNKNWREALAEISAHIRKDLAGKSCDLLMVFLSEPYEDFDAQAFAHAVTHLIPAATVLACNSSGVIEGKREIEMEPAISAMAMHLPGVTIYPFQISEADMVGVKTGSDLIKLMDIYPTDKPKFLCLSDPNTFDVVRLMQLFNEGYKGLPVVGGLASGAMMNKPNWICLNGKSYQEGLVGLALVGDIEFDIVVSQGCRPVGKPYVITKAEQNVLYELAGKPALDVVRELIEGLSAKDKKLAEFSLSVGLVINENQTTFKRGDFLIRNLVGFDPDSSSLMIGSLLKVGQTLQFQVRDAEASSEDFDHMLEKIAPDRRTGPRGGILVSCCGRGKNFYGKPDHDAKSIQTIHGPIPLTGFFANGEIGPVGFKNFVHGYTSSLAIIK